MPRRNRPALCRPAVRRGQILSGAPLMESCTECDRHWRVYQDAVRTHIQILGEYKIAVIQENSATLTKLDPLLSAAEKCRRDARQAVKDHEATHGRPFTR